MYTGSVEQHELALGNQQRKRRNLASICSEINRLNAITG